MVKFRRLFPVLFAFPLSLGMLFGSFDLSTALAVGESAAPMVIIDPGHGGEDAGAIGAQGTKEKDLNFAVATALLERFREAGVHAILTRTEDTLVLKEGENVKGQKKAKDLYNRAALAEAYPDATFISIHMNAYPVAKYRGLQVYYNKASAESASLAKRITDNVRKNLDPIYTRVPNFRGDELYLLSHIKGCAVLVECGFLSNPEEEEKLLEKDYQNKLSFCIFYAMMEG